MSGAQATVLAGVRLMMSWVSTMLVGTAGWTVDRRIPNFAQEGTALERYASVFPAVEINTSFYRRHRPSTWQRWHDAVPDTFTFSVKLPKIITHEGQLENPQDELKVFFEDVVPLGNKLGAILVQLPPKLEFDRARSERFLKALRAETAIAVYLEPRHVSWAAASKLLHDFSVGRVYADPQAPELRPLLDSGKPRYLRLHGSPKIYYSAYTNAEIDTYADVLSKSAPSSWCIFDNTASGAAIHDALKVLERVGSRLHHS